MSDTEKNNNRTEIKLDIPVEEAWSYKIEGLRAPMIGKKAGHSAAKKIIVVITLVITIGISIYLSIRALHSDVYQYAQISEGWQLSKFSNPGDITEITIDNVEGDESKPINTIREYAFNCDDKLTSINIGKTVAHIDGKSFYSIWNLQTIYVDADNQFYCDVDGVLYNKDKTEIICYPIDHDKYLRDKSGYEEELWPDNEAYDNAYVESVRTYVIPDSVTKIGELAFNYADLVKIYLPEGIVTIDNLAFFKAVNLAEIITYTEQDEYRSLPNGLEYIGTDAFSYDQALTYMFIPKSVKHIGHHAFWDSVYKEKGKIKGLGLINIEADEQTFKSCVEAGDHWLPKYDYKLFKKTIDVSYSAKRDPIE